VVKINRPNNRNFSCLAEDTRLFNLQRLSIRRSEWYDYRPRYGPSLDMVLYGWRDVAWPALSARVVHAIGLVVTSRLCAALSVDTSDSVDLRCRWHRAR